MSSSIPTIRGFSVLDPRIREGGDNPDQRYLIATLRVARPTASGERWDRLERLDFQVYAGNPYLPGDGGRSASHLDFEDVRLDADGGFEVFAAPTPTGPNWLENPPDGSRILVRQIYSEWADAAPGEVHIDRLGHEGDAKPAPTGADMAGRLRRAAANLVPHVRIWPEMVRVGYVERLGANRLSPPFDPGTLGGVPGRWMASGSFDLEPDDALIVTTWPAGGDYQGIQLADLWFSPLEYANRQTSLTGDQSSPRRRRRVPVRRVGDGSRCAQLARHDGPTAGGDPAAVRRDGPLGLRPFRASERHGGAGCRRAPAPPGIDARHAARRSQGDTGAPSTPRATPFRLLTASATPPRQRLLGALRRRRRRTRPNPPKPRRRSDGTWTTIRIA